MVQYQGVYNKALRGQVEKADREETFGKSVGAAIGIGFRDSNMILNSRIPRL